LFIQTGDRTFLQNCIGFRCCISIYTVQLCQRLNY
jgi:hypothetical protein